MSDITLCANNKTNGCKLSVTCKRAQTTPNEHWQSYSDFSPWRDGQECDGYFHIETDEELREGISEARKSYYQDNHL